MKACSVVILSVVILYNEYFKKKKKTLGCATRVQSVNAETCKQQRMLARFYILVLKYDPIKQNESRCWKY